LELIIHQIKRMLIKLLGICLSGCPAFQKSLGKGPSNCPFPFYLSLGLG
jgi:hypothetical protein